MNLVSRSRVRDPTVLASIACEQPGDTKSESQKVLLSWFNVQLAGTGKPVTLASSSNSSEWNNDEKWSSQVRKSGEMSKTSTVKLVSNNLVIDIDMDSATAAESDIFLKSRSFLNRVNDRLRKMCERCVFDKSVTLLIRESAQGTSLRTDPHEDEDEVQENKVEDEIETVKRAEWRVEENQNNHMSA